MPLFQLGKMRAKLVSDFQLLELLHCALVLKGHCLLFDPY